VARQRNQQQPRYRVAIVGDGQTERIYFDNVRDTDRPGNLAIFPDSPKKIGNYKGVLTRAEQLSQDYDRVYALIDHDKVIHDNQQQAYAAAKKKIESIGVIVLENNPCFELWLLLHFVYTTKLFSDCDEVSELLKSHIPNYSKSEKFLAKAELYKKYKDRISIHAIPNAKRLEANRAGQDELFPRAQTFQFFEWYFANL
jgi:hypothetical protein